MVFRPGPDEESGPDRVPLPGPWPRVVPDGVGATRRGSTSTNGSSTGCTNGYHADGDAVPLGPAPGVAGQGRLGEPGLCQVVRGQRRRWGSARSGTADPRG